MKRGTATMEKWGVKRAAKLGDRGALSTFWEPRLLQCHFDKKFKAHLCSNSAKQTSWYLDLCCSPANSPARPRKNVRFAQNASLSSAFLMISLEINLSILSRPVVAQIIPNARPLKIAAFSPS